MISRSSTISISRWHCTGSVGSQEKEQDQTYFELAFVLSGAFVFQGPVGRAVADTNTVICFNQGEHYRTSHSLGCGSVGSSLIPSSELLAEALQVYRPEVLERMGPSLPFLSVSSSPRTFLLHWLLTRHIVCGSVSDLAVEETALFLFDTIWRDHARMGDRADQHAAFKRHEPSDRVEHVKRLLVKRLSSGVTLAELADAVGVSSYYLTRLFKRETGIPVHRYLNRLRLRAAMNEVIKNEDDLTEAALAAGFSSHSHFSWAFRMEFGMQPSAFRRMGRGSSGFGISVLRALLPISREG